jgi:hypothetical protein
MSIPPAFSAPEKPSLLELVGIWVPLVIMFLAGLLLGALFVAVL